MKYVLASFDDARRAKDALARVEGYGKVRRIGSVDALSKMRLDSNDSKRFASDLQAGNTVLCAEVHDRDATRAANDFQAIPTGSGETGYGKTTGTTGYAASGMGTKASTGPLREGGGTIEETSVPIMEEKLEVGKHEVDRGGVRIVTHVVERPYDESIWLHEEEIEVERRPAHRAPRAGETIGDRTIEVHARGEEADVRKSVDVVEEVVVKKSDHVHEEKIRESLKHTEVDVKREGARASRPSLESRPSVR